MHCTCPNTKTRVCFKRTTSFDGNNNKLTKNKENINLNGIGIGVIEICLYLLTSFFIRLKYSQYKDINVFTYYWLTMTVLTGFWESVYIYNYKKIVNQDKLSKEEKKILKME